MISKDQIAELRKAISANRYEGIGYDKIVYEITDNLLDTLEALYEKNERLKKENTK